MRPICIRYIFRYKLKLVYICCCSPLSCCTPQSGFQVSRKLSSLMASVGLLHKSSGVEPVARMSPVNKKILDVLRYISAVGTYLEASMVLDPTFVGAHELAIS